MEETDTVELMPKVNNTEDDDIESKQDLSAEQEVNLQEEENKQEQSDSHSAPIPQRIEQTIDLNSEKYDTLNQNKSFSTSQLQKRNYLMIDEPMFKTWFSITCNVFQIDLNQQQYHARIRMNIFWNDRDIVHEYEEEKQKAKEYLSFKEFLKTKNKNNEYYLPMDVLQMKNFANAVTMVNDIENVHLFVHRGEKGNIPQMVITFDGILSEQFEMSRYPFDKQFVNVRIRFNVKAQEKYRITTTKPSFVSFKEGHDYFSLLKVSKGDALTDWDILDPWLDLHHFDQECFILRLRLQRRPSLVIVRIILPLIIVSAAPFMIYALTVNEYADRLGILATLLLTLVAFHSLLNDSLPPSELSTIDWYIIVSYTSILLMGIGVCISDEDNEQFPFELTSYISAGMLFVSVLYLFVWKWFRLVANDKDQSWKKLAIRENLHLGWNRQFVKVQKRGIFAKNKYFTI